MTQFKAAQQTKTKVEVIKKTLKYISGDVAPVEDFRPKSLRIINKAVIGSAVTRLNWFTTGNWQTRVPPPSSPLKSVQKCIVRLEAAKASSTLINESTDI